MALLRTQTPRAPSGVGGCTMPRGCRGPRGPAACAQHGTELSGMPEQRHCISLVFTTTSHGNAHASWQGDAERECSA